ncbi:unknown protein [Seminavis robusta]|uniref:Uncharacterized protein n=1 Tax=Seminavis robusta TaxID=568900 RepID=A0A9N8EQZ4_9STRA|nr:unknown protein [Seminavis robusta]|eukprot:Sro1701_g292200.1 n/a (544) ;mRNA; r:14002-15633
MSSWNPNHLSQFETQQEATQYAASPEIVLGQPTRNLFTAVPPEPEEQEQPKNATPPKVTQPFGISELSPWTQDQFASLMGFNNNKKKMAKRKIGNGRGTLVSNSKKAKAKTAPKPPPAAAVMPQRAGTPPMPPLQGVDRRKGCCEALGNECPYPQLEAFRHKCGSCRMFVHALPPCSIGQKDTGDIICKNCDGDGTGAARTPLPTVALEDFEDEDSAEEGNKSPDMLVTQVDDEENEEDEEDEEEEMQANVAVETAKKRNLEVEQLSQFLNGKSKQDQKKTRGKNFTVDEDVYMTESWCSATEDSRSGSDQRQSDFDKKFFANYVTKVDEHNEAAGEEELPRNRQQRSVVNRFGVIKHGTNKLIGIINQNPIKSGETPEDHLERCLTMYEHSVGSKFQFVECFEILKDFPKFSSSNDTGKKRADGKKHTKKPRAVGKRQAALNDKIGRILENQGMNAMGGKAVQEAASVSEAIGQISTHLVNQVAVSQWSETDKEEYFKNDAMEKRLMQKRRILKLQREIKDMENEDAAGNRKESSEDSDDSD